MDEQSIFLEALQKETPEDRAAFLADACGDDEGLRHEVEMLLKAHDKVGDFLQAPAGITATIDPPITEKPGSQIGPYKLLQQLGEGGMGVVYMAEQKEPVKRRVALKIIKPGMDTRQVIARFEAERQALAMMDHPNIAKVLDAGASVSGSPYFVMELVNGLSVTTYCDEQHLTPKERLELFVPICQAVQHAHQKGIIHRDLKPSNILVALYDGQPVPKIIDFGVAKATSQTLTEKTMFTQLGQVVGTLEYMSPEQAERNQLDIDTRSDIYSLGVVLYELLTGDTPFDRQRLRSVAFDEMLRIIREEEPPKPSTKLSSSEALPSVAANRHIDPERLTLSVRGELDWIVMKALEKDRARRYGTAGELAADVKRHLTNEPVAAGPPTAAYRLRKFVGKHRAAVATVGAAAAGLVLCLLLVLNLYMRAEDARTGAEQARAAESRRSAELRTALQQRDTALGEKIEALATTDAALSAKAASLTRSEALRLTAQSTIALPDDPALALLLAVAAAKHGPPSGMLNNALLAAMSACRERRTISVRESSGGGRDYGRLAVHAAAYGPDGTRVLTVAGGSYDRQVTLNTETDILGQFEGSTTLRSRFSQQLGVAQVWDADSGRLLVTIEAPPNQRFRLLRFSPDGRRLAATMTNATLVRFAGGETHLYTDRVVRIYDATNGKALAVLKGHTGPVVSARFSPDGSQLVTASWDGTARTWNAGSGEPLTVVEASAVGNLEDARFTPDGRHIVTLCSSTYQRKSYADDPSRATQVDPSQWQIDPAPGRREAVTDQRAGDWGNSSTGFATRAAVAFAQDSETSSVELPGLRVWDAVDGQPVASWIAEAGQEAAGAVRAFCFSQDGAWMATGDQNGGVAVWSCADHKPALRFQAHDSVVESLEFGAGDQRLLVTHRDGGVVLHDARDGARLGFWSAKPGVRTALGQDGDRVIIADDVGRQRAGSVELATVLALDAAGKRGPILLKGHVEHITALEVSPSGERLLSASADGTARVWSLAETAGYGQSFPAPGPVQAALCSPSGEYLAVANGGPGKLAKIYDTRTGQQASVLEVQSDSREPRFATRTLGRLRRIEFSPTADRILTLSEDRHLRIISAKASLVELNSMATDEWPVARQLHTPQVRVWDAATGRELFALQGQSLDVRWAAFSPDGTRILTLAAPWERHYCVYPPDDQMWAQINVNAPDRSAPLVHVWDASDGKLLYSVRDLQNPHSEWGTISWAPDGRSFAASKLSGWLDLSKQKWLLVTGVSSAAAPRFSPDGRYLLWRTSDEAELLELGQVRPTGGRFDSLELSTHGADGDQPKSVRLRGATHHGNQLELQGLPARFTLDVFSSDGRYLATATEDHAAQLWETASGRLVHVLHGHLRKIEYASFSPDGRWLVTASNDHTARVWNVASGHETLTFRGHQGNVRTAVFSPDSRFVATAGDDGTARYWPVDPLPLAIARMPRELTAAEREQYLISEMNDW